MPKGIPRATIHDWTPDEDEWMRQNVPGHGERWLIDNIETTFGWRPTTAQVASRKTKLGVISGTHGGQFKKGQEPFNKGKRQVEFMSAEGIERTKATRFKNGEVRQTSHIRPLGFERISKDGYVEVKVSDGLQESPNRNFTKKHVFVYESNYGPVPKGHKVVFADCDKRNFDPENLVAVPNREWLYICSNRIDYHDRESLAEAIAIARLNGAITDARFRPRKCELCGSEFEPPRGNAHVNRTCPDCITSGRKAGRRNRK